VTPQAAGTSVIALCSPVPSSLPSGIQRPLQVVIGALLMKNTNFGAFYTEMARFSRMACHKVVGAFLIH